jgi:FAD/FMN-containing dehydrogenase
MRKHAGTSGSFGIISRVQVELQRLPVQTATALVVPTEHRTVPALLTLLESNVGEFLSAFEGMSRNALHAALNQSALAKSFCRRRELLATLEIAMRR